MSGVAEEAVSVPSLLVDAETRSGLTDWGDRSFLEPLNLLVESCRATARLNPTGWQVLGKAAVRHLRNRLALEAYLTAHPERRCEEIGPPIVITGLPRTGTTLLHNLLALDPAHRFLRFWEALRPLPPDPATGASEDELVRQAETWLERLYRLSPGLAVIHRNRAEGPEECDVLFQNSFASQHFDDMFGAEAYSAWLNHSDLELEYAYYRLQLGVLSQPRDRGLVWVLKSPSHLGYLDTLLRTLPGALVVQCHRDPLEAVPSYASLVQAVREPYSDSVSPASVGEHVLRRSGVASERALAARRLGGEDRFVDIAYQRLTRDPIGCARTVYERFGRRLGAGEERAMQRWLDQNPQHGHGVHRYTLEQFDLKPEQVTAAFGTYIDRFADEIA